jgi:hypothetical protein
MLYLMRNGNVTVKGEYADEFESLCQDFGVVGFMSEDALEFHRDEAAKTTLREETVNTEWNSVNLESLSVRHLEFLSFLKHGPLKAVSLFP